MTIHSDDEEPHETLESKSLKRMASVGSKE